jgi:hypothetical protein
MAPELLEQLTVRARYRNLALRRSSPLVGTVPFWSADEVRFVTASSGLCGRIPPTNRQRTIKKA